MLRGFPRSVPWEFYVPIALARSLARCNFDFHARYARKSRKLRARAARVKLRAGYWISFLKTFVTPTPSQLDPRTRSPSESIRRFIKGSRINERIAWKIHSADGFPDLRPLSRRCKPIQRVRGFLVSNPRMRTRLEIYPIVLITAWSRLVILFE